MNCMFKIPCLLCIISCAAADVTYFHERFYTEIKTPSVRDGTDFGFSMAFSSKKTELVIGAPRYDLIGKAFQCSLKEVFSNSAICTEIDIDMDKVAGDYSRERAPDQNFFLGSSIAVASDFIVICAPLWRTVLDRISVKLHYGIYGVCFVVTNKVQRMKGLFEQLPYLEKINEPLGKVYGGTGWSTLIDEANNLTLVSLSPFTTRTDIGYYDTVPPLDPMKFMRIYKKFDHVFKDIGTFTSGRFFEDKKVTYAFSSRRKKMIGVVAFLQRPSKATGVWEVMEKNKDKPLYIEALDTEVGSMFGAALHAVDLNADGFSDLLVGAPTQGGKDSLLYDSGAIHIFLGGDKNKMKERRTILFTKSGGQFGRTIATNDVDGDKILEIFVSAPFEDSGNGAVYILNGQELKSFLERTEPFTQKRLTEFKLTQRVQNSNYRWLGYSLQTLPDLDDNGCNELAVGAPKSEKVLLYRSVAVIVVDVSADIDRDYVRQTDGNCSIHLKINVKYPVKPAPIMEALIISMDVVGNEVSIDDGVMQIKQNINSSQSTYEKDIVIKFGKFEPGVYHFSAKVTLEADHSRVFDKSRVMLSPHSNTTVAVTITRQCKGEDCVPILTPNIEFSGGKQYVVGSSSSETVTVTVLNKGDVTYDSCVKILVEGSEVLYINAEQDDAGWYQYLLPKPFVRGASHTMEITVDMSKQTNLETELVITARLCNICNRGKFIEYKQEFPLVLTTNDVYIDGVSHHRNITDTEILDKKTSLITDDHIYTIINNGSVMWKSINAEIKINKQTLIKAYHISTLDSLNCKETEEEGTVIFSCNFNLEKFLKIMVTFDIAKDMFKDNLQKGQLITSSKIELDLQSNGQKKVNFMTTTFHYQVDTSLRENKIAIIAIAVVLSAIFLMTVIYVLHKRGFFKRPLKTKLEELKQEELKQNIKRPHPSEGVRISKNPINVGADETNAEHETNDRHEQNGKQETNEQNEINTGQEMREAQEI